MRIPHAVFVAKGAYYEGHHPSREMPFNPTIPKDYCHSDESIAY
jgi:hypothetical protein